MSSYQISQSIYIMIKSDIIMLIPIPITDFIIDKEIKLIAVDNYLTRFQKKAIIN